MSGSLCALLLGMACSACHFSSRPGDATITLVDGQPCFAVEKSWETRGGVPLYGVFVHAHQWTGSYEEAKRWRISLKLDAPQAKTSAESCLRYGHTPDGFEEIDRAPLEPYTVYSVTIDAKPERSWRNTFTYGALFCLTPDQSGKITVHDISRDNSLGPSRFDVCRKP